MEFGTIVDPNTRSITIRWGWGDLYRPVSQHASRHNEPLVTSSQKSSNCARNVLRDICRGSDRADTDAEAADEASDVERSEVPPGVELENNANQNDHTSDEQSHATAELVSKRRCDNGSGETPSL